MVSVIIPAFNEQEELPESLRRLARNCAEHEVIIVDAGSSDETARIGHEMGGRIIRSPRKQRAGQMNFGAAEAKGDSLLFLHADTWLGDSALSQIERILQDSAYVGGGFAREFRSPSIFLRITCRLAEARCRAFGWFLGDQGIFVRRAVFEALVGFQELDQFEDLDFCRRMKACGQLAIIRPPILSSARRFQNGAFTRTAQDLRLTGSYLVRNLRDSSSDREPRDEK